MWEVQAIIEIVGMMQVSGIGWTDIARMIKEEKKAGNHLAGMIYKLNLEKSQVTLLLDADDEEQENMEPVVRVDVDLDISA